MEQELTPVISWEFLDYLQEGVILCLPDGRLLRANPAARALFPAYDESTTLNDLLAAAAPPTDWEALLTPPASQILRLPAGPVQLRSCWPAPGQQDMILLLAGHLRAVTATGGSGRPRNGVSQLATLTRISRETDFDRQLQLIVDGLQQAGWGQATLTLRDETFRPTRLLAAPDVAGAGSVATATAAQSEVPPAAWLTLFQEGDRYRRGACFFVPGSSDWSRRHLGAPAPAPQLDPDSWQPYDLLAVPLRGRHGQNMGLILLDRPRHGQRPDHATVETTELFAQFAAAAIENSQLIDEALARSRELETLFQAGKALAHTLEKETVLDLLGHHLLQAAAAAAVTIYRWRAADGSLIGLVALAPSGDRATPPGVSPAPTAEAGTAVTRVIEARAPVAEWVQPAEAPWPPRPSWLPADRPYMRLLLPIVLSEEVYGLVELVRPDTGAVQDQDLQLLLALVNQASTALETALVFEETYARERFYNALGNVSLAINYTLELDAVLNLICEESRRIFGVDGAYIWLRQADRFVGRAAAGHGAAEFLGQEVAITETDEFAWQVATRRRALYANDLSGPAARRFRLPPQPAIQAALGVPLEQDGQVVGVLALVDLSHPFRFGDRDVAQATTLGVQATIALQNARLFAELRQLNEELDMRVARRTQALHEESNRVKVLLRITTELSASLDQDRVLHKALHLVNGVVHATQGVILLIDQVSGELMFRAAFGAGQQPSPRGIPSGLMRDEGLAGWIIAHRTSVIVQDTREDPRWVHRPTSRDHRSVLAVPLLVGAEVIGVLMMFHNQPRAFTNQQLDLVEAAAIQVANALNNANLYLLIRDQAERLGSSLHLEQIETAKNQAILESIADGVIFADENNTITLANVPAGRILGIPRQALIGKSINEFLGLYGQSEHSWLAAIEEWAADAGSLRPGVVIAEQLPLEDKVVSVHLSPVSAGAQFFGTVSIFRDISKEVELDRLKSEFVSTVSHELRTPMTSIKGYIDLLLMGAAEQMSDAQTRYLQVVKNNAERLHMLVNDLLDISRIETGKTALDLRPVDVGRLMSDVVEGHLRGRIQHENKAMEVQLNVPTDLPLVQIDKARITQVVTNLLDNAFNYTPAGGQIQLNARQNGRHVFVTVQDSGIGIRQEDQERIFDRFYRAEHELVQRVPGTGLGLAIVRSLVEMHSGQLTLDSRPGAGSAFTFNLPIVTADGGPGPGAS